MAADGLNPSPSDLWQQAQAQHPDDPRARRERYFALMREHGHIIDKPECPHLSATGVNQTPLNDPSKVWTCDSCGWRYVVTNGRMEQAPGMP